MKDPGQVRRSRSAHNFVGGEVVFHLPVADSMGREENHGDISLGYAAGQLFHGFVDRIISLLLRGKRVSVESCLKKNMPFQVPWPTCGHG